MVPLVGPEVIAGSTRMKAGTAQKLALNMLSTATMVRLGRVLSHWMINLQLNNRKLWKRGVAILSQATSTRPSVAERALEESGRNLSAALLMLSKKIPKDEALRLLRSGENSGVLRRCRVGDGKVKRQSL
jgi:N-acetylmuramic acid 6-phosphate etherase